jgi:hypothetical protein
MNQQDAKTEESLREDGMSRPMLSRRRHHHQQQQQQQQQQDSPFLAIAFLEDSAGPVSLSKNS